MENKEKVIIELLDGTKEEISKEAYYTILLHNALGHLNEKVINVVDKLKEIN